MCCSLEMGSAHLCSGHFSPLNAPPLCFWGTPLSESWFEAETTSLYGSPAPAFPASLRPKLKPVASLWGPDSPTSNLERKGNDVTKTRPGAHSSEHAAAPALGSRRTRAKVLGHEVPGAGSDVVRTAASASRSDSHGALPRPVSSAK